MKKNQVKGGGKKMKKTLSAFALLLVVSLFATGFVLAEETESDDALTDFTSDSDISRDTFATPDGDRDESSADSFSQGTASGQMESQFRAADMVKDISPSGSTRAYYGHGWATSENEGYVVQALWMRNTVDNLKELSETEKQIAMMGGGLIRVGVGSEAKIFRLIKTTSPPNEIVFDFRSIDETSTEIVGNLHLVRKSYSEVSKWEGHLVINEPSYTVPREYDIEMGTRSIEVEDVEDVRRLKVSQDKRPILNMPYLRTIVLRMSSIFD